jgi:hypothetical protein
MRSLGRDQQKPPRDSSSTPELLADRIITFAELVGQENVIAGSTNSTERL